MLARRRRHLRRVRATGLVQGRGQHRDQPQYGKIIQVGKRFQFRPMVEELFREPRLRGVDRLAHGAAELRDHHLFRLVDGVGAPEEHEPENHERQEEKGREEPVGEPPSGQRERMIHRERAHGSVPGRSGSRRPARPRRSEGLLPPASRKGSSLRVSSLSVSLLYSGFITRLRWPSCTSRPPSSSPAA